MASLFGWWRFLRDLLRQHVHDPEQRNADDRHHDQDEPGHARWPRRPAFRPRNIEACADGMTNIASGAAPTRACCGDMRLFIAISGVNRQVHADFP